MTTTGMRSIPTLLLRRWPRRNDARVAYPGRCHARRGPASKRGVVRSPRWRERQLGKVATNTGDYGKPGSTSSKPSQDAQTHHPLAPVRPGRGFGSCGLQSEAVETPGAVYSPPMTEKRPEMPDRFSCRWRG